MLVKYAKAEITGVKSSAERIKTATLDKFSSYEDYRTDDGYLYVRVRAISSRVNKNHDGWPASELQKAWRTFIGKPIFVDHHNTDPKKARGVVVDASIHVDEDTQRVAALDPYYATAPKEHLPATHIELLLEVDATSFPRLAKAIIDGDIDSVSMGANVERSVCSHCKNEARNPDEFCDHVRSKGALFEYTDEAGRKTAKKSYEDCYDIGFFEISCVFDPADTTALMVSDSLRHAKVAAEVHAEVGDRLELNVLDFKDAATADAFAHEINEMLHTAAQPIKGPQHEIGAIVERDGKQGEVVDSKHVEAPSFSDDYGHRKRHVKVEWKDGAPEYDTDREWFGAADVQPAGKTANMPISGQCAGCGAPTSGSELCDVCSGGQQSMIPGQQQGLVPSPTMGQTPGRLTFVTAAEADEFAKTADIGPIPTWFIDSLGMIGIAGAAAGSQAHDLWQKYLRTYGARPQPAKLLVQTLKGLVGGTSDASAMQPGQPQVYDQQAAGNEHVITKTADRRNPPPQSDMQTAPDKVDTLRQELTCPVCGSTMEDGVCEVCNHEEPPEGFDNPDLSKAKEVDEQMRQEQSQDAAMAEGQSPEQAPTTPDSAAPPTPGVMSSATTSSATASAVSSDGTKTAAGEQNSGRINVKERPILPPTRQNSDKPKNVQVVQDHHQPVESNTRGAEMSDKQKTADGSVATDPDARVNPTGTGAAISDVSPDKVVDVTGTGGVMPVTEAEHQSVDKAVNVTGEPTKTWSEDKNAPGVTSETGEQVNTDVNFHGAAEKVAEKVPGPDVPAVADTLDVNKPIGSEEVGEGTKTWHKDENAPAVTPEASPNTVNLHGAKAEGRRHAIACIKLAEAEIEVGVTEADAKFDRIAELEDESVETIEAQIATLSKVKTAGLRKPQLPKRTAASRVPSLRGGGIRTAAPTASEIDPDSPEGDAALFLTD